VVVRSKQRAAIDDRGFSMKAVVFHGVGDIRVDEVPEPTIREPTDVIVRLTASAICGTDLHFVRGTMPGTKEGRILGHEGVGIVEAVGDHDPAAVSA
jgi:threonine dehydrogenase-like Zn-dependent dehydrogenase